MMYPRNSASPEPIAIGPVVQISDGAVQSSGVTVRVKPIGVTEADGGGTTAYSTDGVVLYTPTQAETNYTSFVLIAKKTGCIPASVTVVTSARSVTGEVQVGGYASGQVPLQPTVAGRTLDVTATGAAGIDLANVENQGSTLNLSGVTIKNATDNASQTSVNAIPTNPLLTTDSRLNNLDFAISTVNNNILNLNNLSAKMNLFGSPLLEIPESGSTVYAFTLVVKDDEDKLVALDSSPTVTAANAAGTSRSANLSAVSNPSTGRYTFTYTVASTHPAESLRISVSGTVSGEARYIEWIGAVVDYDTLTTLLAIKAKTDNLPVNPASTSDIPTANQNRDAVMNAMPNGGWVNGSFGDRWLIGANDNREVQVTGSNHISADVHAFQAGVIDATAIADNAIDAGSIAAGALNGKGDWLTTLGANAPANWINAAAIATDAIDSDAIADSAKTEIANAVAALQVLSRLDSMIESDGAGQFRFDTIAVSLAAQGGGGGAVNISVEDQSITVC